MIIKPQIEKPPRQKREKVIKFTTDEARKKVDDLLAIKEERLKKIGTEKNDKNVSDRDAFIILEREHLSSLFNLKRLRGPLALYFYLRSYVNRKPSTHFANLGRYFQEGYLATARTQSWLKRELGVPQTTFGFWFSVLEQDGFIIPIGSEMIKVGKTFEPVTVYALGELRNIDGYTTEIWYMEIL